jgi:hydroxymethylpyrimidine/phosphomethylpyrimidine kinase
MEKKVVLSIAGSDPSAGAGIQADLKSFSFLGLYGVSVVTCVTSQNTMQVKNIQRLPVEIVESQIDVLFEDFTIDAVKTGMLFDEEIIKLVSKKIAEYDICPVVDPVMVATSGDALSQNTFTASFKKYLMPKTFLLTANIPEASKIAGVKIKTIDDVIKSCKKLYDSGPKYVLVKGGHLDTTDAVDVFYDGKTFHKFSLPRISNKKAHGSGCSLSAIVTGLVAQGETPVDAVRKAKHIIWSMINEGYTPGNGSDVLNHSCEKILPLNLSDDHVVIWAELKDAVEKLTSFLSPSFVPEVGMNFAYALKNAKTFGEICAVDGRILKTKEKVKLCGDISFGASRHVASIVLAAMSFDKNIRSVVNIRYSKNNLDLCKQAGFRIGFFDRKNEPKAMKSTMEWGTKQSIKDLGFVPDIIYDLGGIGKEPMIRILGKNPKDVLLKTQRLLKSDIK